MNENRFFLWTKIFIKIKTRNKIKCSQKNVMGGGGNFHGGKLTPENASQENCPPPWKFAPPSPKEKNKRRKLTPENIISKVKCKRKKRDDKKID